MNTQYDAYINDSAARYGVDPKLIKAIIQQESGFNPNARSGVGAGGLMQLMPATARGLGVSNIYDPKQNIEGGTKYISQMLKQYNGKVDVALAAYNAGSGNVKKYGGIPPFSETQKYVKNIMAAYKGIGLTGSEAPSGTTGMGTQLFSGALRFLLVGFFFILAVVFFFKVFPVDISKVPIPQAKVLKLAKAVT